MGQTGIELLAADLGTTPGGLLTYIAIGACALIVVVVWACWKLSSTPATEGFPSGPTPHAPRPTPGKKAA